MPRVSLNASFEGIQGTMGNIVYQNSPEGTVSRAYVIPHDPHTPAQTGVRTAFAQATEAYKNLTAAQVKKWEAYAAGITRRKRNGGTTHPTAIDVFVGRACKFLQITPDGVIPVLPPANPFFADAIAVRAASNVGAVQFNTTGSNTGTTLTEFVLQRLVGAASQTFARQLSNAGFCCR